MPIKFYFDEDSSDSDLIEVARTRGLDVLSTQEAGNRGNSDRKQLEFAASCERVLFSCNVGDFIQLHTDFLLNENYHAGILLAKQRGFSIGEKVRRMLNLVNSKSAEEMQNNLEFLSNW